MRLVPSSDSVRTPEVSALLAFFLESTPAQRIDSKVVWECPHEVWTAYLAGAQGLVHCGPVCRLLMFTEVLLAAVAGLDGYFRTQHMLRVNHTVLLSKEAAPQLCSKCARFPAPIWFGGLEVSPPRSSLHLVSSCT